MRLPNTTRYRFRIRTRDGAVLENLMIPGRSSAEAERKVRQIYRDCEILSEDSYSQVASQLQSSLTFAILENLENLDNVVPLNPAAPAKKIAGR